MSSNSAKSEPGIILIDIRSDSEVFEKHFDQTMIHSPALKGKINYSTYNIPMNMIRFNVETILDHLQWVDKIYLVCRSGRRSQFIKDKYFANNPRILVDKQLQFQNFQAGINTVVAPITGDKFNIPVVVADNWTVYSITRIVQIMLGLVIIVCVMISLYQLGLQQVNKRGLWALYILLLFGIMALFNGLTSTCILSQLLEDILN